MHVDSHQHQLPIENIQIKLQFPKSFVALMSGLLEREEKFELYLPQFSYRLRLD